MHRRIKKLMFRRMEGMNRRGRPHREWLDNITEWGKASLQEQEYVEYEYAVFIYFIERRF